MAYDCEKALSCYSVNSFTFYKIETNAYSKKAKAVLKSIKLKGKTFPSPYSFSINFDTVNR